MKKILILILFVCILGGGYSYKGSVKNFIQQHLSYFAPCWQPITYSLGNFDEKFGLQKEAFLAHMQRAENIWESQSQSEFFEYVETWGDLTINLIYDERQASVDELKKIGIVISDNQATYDALKAKHASLTLAYNQQKKTLESEIQNLKKLQNAYTQDVDYWNSRGGAPSGEYQKLEQRRKNINALVSRLNEFQVQLNSQVNTINALTVAINQLIDTLNLNVDKFNTTSTANGEEFSAGEYILDSEGQRIQIYEFENETKLIRVLTHELWHALWLMHVSDPEAIMYKLNQGKNETLTEADIAELTAVCDVP